MDNNYNTPSGNSSEQQNNNYVQYEPENGGQKKSKGLSIASMVIGLVMFILGCCIFSCIAVYTSEFAMIVPAAISLLGAVLGIIALVKKCGGKGMAITGIITSVLAFFASLYMLVSFATLNKALEPTGYTMNELVQALSNGDITQEEYMEIINDAMMQAEGN